MLLLLLLLYGESISDRERTINEKTHMIEKNEYTMMTAGV